MPFFERESLLPLLGLLTVACSPAYTYVPETNATATVAGRSAADYPIPPEQPQGDVRVASFGFADMAPQGVEPDEEHSTRALHLRLVVANNSDKPWTLDTREQRLDLAGHGQSAPIFASANPGTPPPVVTIPPAGKRVVDLFFPLPVDEQRASKVPEFDAIWTVHTDTRAVTERVPFSRIMVEPEPTPYDYGPDYWWQPPYYYDGTVVRFGVAPLGPIWGGSFVPGGIFVHGYHDVRGYHERRGGGGGHERGRP